MKATDITWGGEAKCEFKVVGEMPVIQTGAVINLEYDYVSQKYSMIDNGNKYTILPINATNRSVLDEYVRDGGWRANLTRVVDVQENNVIVQMHIFYSTIEFNQLQTLKIQISNNVVDRLPKYAKSDPIKFVNDEFIYNQNIVFAYNFESQVKLQIISKSWRLDVDRKGNEYIASNIRRDTSDIKNLVYMLRGSIEFVDSTQNARVSKEVAEKLQAITNSDSYFSIWDAYNDIEKLMLFEQAVEYGVAEYTSYEVEVRDAFIYKFKLKENALEDLVDEDTQIDCTDNAEILRIEKSEDLQEIRDFKPKSVGKIIRIRNNILYVVDENRERKERLPKAGYLFKSIAGDSVKIKRRIIARDEITKGMAPMPNLALLINDGVSTIKQFRNEQPITTRLKNTMKRDLGKTIDINLAQQKAIEIALNTPDIALIQGPPGTGKTTVIKAIIARFEEYFQKNNDEIPKILVTSFQHEAVDNAISNMNPSGLPANRIGRRRGEESKQQATIVSWVIKEDKRCSALIEGFKIPQIYEKLNVIKDEYFSWYSKGKDLLDGINILKRIVQIHRLDLSYELINTIDEVLASANFDNENLDGIRRVADIDSKTFAQIVGKQRIDKTSFEDDGINNALELRYAIEYGLAKGEVIPECLLNVISTKGADEKVFTKYKAYVKSLQEKYLTEVKKSDNKKISTEEIELCIDRALKELQNALLKMRSNVNEAKAQILQKYKDIISDEQIAGRIIDRYSNIKAATCQQAMVLGKNAEAEHYDLVIVDEAARAIPLDLFIPMSMGKQVILVGDHKQLPHLLEPEVVKKLNQDNKQKELETLNKSLFERLYNIFEEQRKTGGLQRTCQLDMQYRMHPLINDFVSDTFYDGKLKCGLTEQDRNLNLNLFNNKPIVWINVSKQSHGIEKGGKGKEREQEAIILIENLIKVLRGNEDVNVGIITFYARQKVLLEQMCDAKLTSDEKSRIDIGTVDAFQGKEFDVIFLSCVRANNDNADNLRRRVGFVNDPNRLCVSFSRAKSLLVVVGDSETVSVVKSLERLVELCKSGKGEYIDA
jgi:superfamily I DNA and/or RNA helicase